MPVVEVVVGGVSFRAQEHDDARYGSFWASFGSGGFEPATVELLRQHVVPGAVVLDGGAWIGPFTLLAAALGATVVAFEPDPVARAQLLANLELNPAFAERVRVRPEALAASAGRRRLDGTRVGLGNGRSRLARRARRGPHEPASGIEVDTVDARGVDLAGVAVVKLDLEGGEFEVLPRVAPALRRHRPLLLLSVHGRDPAPGRRRTELARRVASIPRGVRLLWALRSYPVLSRIVDNRSARWEPLGRGRRALLPLRLGEYELVAHPTASHPTATPVDRDPTQACRPSRPVQSEP